MALIPLPPQSFRTLPTIYRRQALYALSLRQPGASSIAVPGYTYTFPLTPSDMQKESTALATIMDLAGDASTEGVSRLVDLWGTTLPVYTLRGSTGAKLHSTDGYLWDGIQSIQRLFDILGKFSSLNKQQQVNGINQLYSLELYDYFLGDFWQVVPVGPRQQAMNVSAPLIPFYTLRFACVRELSAPDPSVLLGDTATSTLAAGLTPALQTVTSFATKILSVY